MNADGWTAPDDTSPPPRRLRDSLGAALALILTILNFSSAGAPLVAHQLIPSWFPRLETEVVEATFYDPTGMEEGEGFEDAPEDAVPGNPAAIEEAEPNPMPTEAPAEGEDVPAAEVTTDAPVPEQPEQDVVDLVTPKDPAEDEVVEPTPTEPEAPKEPTAPVRGKPGGTTEPDASPDAPPVVDKPGIDPTKMKDVGDKSASVNKDTSCTDPHPQIQKIGENHWQVDKDLIDYYTKSISVFNTLGYSRKYHEGDVRGWMIGGFGCKGPLYKAGFRSKDVIQFVNGHKTNDVVQIIGLWIGTKKYGDFEVKLWRKGQVLTHIYTVPKKEKSSKKTEEPKK